MAEKIISVGNQNGDGGNPVAYLTELCNRMEADLEPSGHRQVFAAQLRDLTLIRMLIEIPIRSGNIRVMELGRHLERDAVTGIWRLWIPKPEFMTRTAHPTRNIDHRYSLRTSETIDRYLADGRTKLTGHDQTGLMFLSGASASKTTNGFKSELPFREMNVQAFWRALSKRLNGYFGAEVEPAIFRPFIAAAIRTENLEEPGTGASVLNDSLDTIAEAYKHLAQSEGLRIRNESSRAAKWIN